MEPTTVVAETSPAPVMDVARGPLVDISSDQRAEFRRTGNLPAAQDKPKEEVAAPSEAKPEETVETTQTDTPPKQQERRKPDAESRIKQLTDQTKALRAELDALKAPKPAADPKPVEQPAKVDPQHTRSKPTPSDQVDGKPKYEVYEDYIEDLSDWKVEQRMAQAKRDEQQQNQQKEFKSKIDEAKQRYGDRFDEVLKPAVDTIMADTQIHGVVKSMLNESEVLPDLLYTIGSDPEALANFIQMAKANPGKALRYIALTESLVRDELAGAKEPKVIPAKPITQAPKPPAEIGGRAASPGDALESAAKANDFRSFKAEATRRELARMKG